VMAGFHILAILVLRPRNLRYPIPNRFPPCSSQCCRLRAQLRVDRLRTHNTAVEPHLKVALAQHLPGSDSAAIIAEAKGLAAEIVVFPEMYSNGYARFDAVDPAALACWLKGAQSMDGCFVQTVRRAAKKHGIYAVATLLEAADPKPFNSALLIGPDGQTVIHHRKVHICDFDSPECACAKGEDFRVATMDTSAGPVSVGLLICMDREYPEAARALSRAGAEIALVPNCCDLASDKAGGDVRIAQMRGRAFEMVMGIAVANYPAPRSDGHSFAVDALGKVIAIAGGAPGLILANFDLSLIRRVRREDHFRWRV
jgi:predicted amidohydrolase